MQLKQLFCKHDYKWLDDIYYPYCDGSNMSEVHQCSKCGKYKRVRKLDLSNYGTDRSIEAGLRFGDTRREE